jgi:hypothetical protein
VPFACQNEAELSDIGQHLGDGEVCDDAFALAVGRFFRREGRVRARVCVGGML